MTSELPDPQCHFCGNRVRTGQDTMQPELPTSLRESRFLMAYSHPTDFLA
jgi:hypothetical protein